MRLKLITDLTEENCYIYIYKNKIVKYTGIYPIGDSAWRTKKVGDIKLNDEFNFFYLDKHDRKEKDTKGTHLIQSRSLDSELCEPMYVKPNIFYLTYLKWHQKKYFIQSVSIRENIITTIIGGVIGLFFGYLLSNLTQNNKVDNQTPTKTPIKAEINLEKEKHDKIDSTSSVKDSVLN